MVDALPTPSGGALMSGMGGGDCYTDPSASACASFTQPDANSTASLDMLCDAMPDMVACTLRQECTNGTGERGGRERGGGGGGGGGGGSTSAGPALSPHPPPRAPHALHAANGPYCSTFSLLGDACLDMGGMRGCEGWNALCTAPGTVVKQCTAGGRGMVWCARVCVRARLCVGVGGGGAGEVR